MRALLLIGLAVAGLSAARHPAESVGAEVFEMRITPRGAGYALTCTTGCGWTESTLTCGTDCRAVIDDGGITMPATEGRPGAKFAFRFHPTSAGWELESLGGTGWQELSWGCRMAVLCTAVVDEHGVWGPVF